MISDTLGSIPYPPETMLPLLRHNTANGHEVKNVKKRFSIRLETLLTS